MSHEAEKKVVSMMAVECAAQLLQKCYNMDRITLFRELPDELKVKTVMLGVSIALGTFAIQSMERKHWQEPEALDDLLAAVRAGYALGLYRAMNPKTDLAEFLNRQMEITEETNGV